MKYFTINYDANKPSPKQLAVPLNSKYGIAVTATKDGAQLSVTSSDVTINDVAAIGETSPYALFELSSGNVPSISKLSVNISADSYVGTFPLYLQTKDMGYFDI